VRARRPGAIVGPFGSVTPAKRGRLVRAVDRLWRRRLAAMKDVERVRVDVAAVTLERGQTKVEYAEGAITG
jgi:Holliday junction resolvase-like predicted endonuclease